MIMTADQYADAEEAKVRFNEDAGTHHPTRCSDERFSWSKEADTAFEQLKLFLTKPLIITVPQPDKTLLIYITATSRVVSTAIVIEREEVGHAYKVQRSVYFISEVLNEFKTRYPQV